MMRRVHRIFLDTSVVFAAVLSETGGARKHFRLAEAGVLQLVVDSNMLRECEDVVQRKVSTSLPKLAYLLELGRVEISLQSPDSFMEHAIAIVVYQPDAHVLAEAIAAEPDWFITHDKIHFLSVNPGSNLAFRIGTPGDLIQSLEDEFTQS